MDMRTRVEGVLESVKMFRQHLWEEHGERDIPASLGFLIDGQEKYEGCPPHVLQDAVNITSDVGSAIKTVLGYVTTWGEFTRFREVIFISDTYVFRGEEGDEMPESLSHDFKTNPNTKITEQVNVFCAADDLVGGVELGTGLLPYHMDDGGVLVFDEAEVLIEGEDGAGRFEGGIPDALRWGVRDAHS